MQTSFQIANFVPKLEDTARPIVTIGTTLPTCPVYFQLLRPSVSLTPRSTLPQGSWHCKSEGIHA